MLNQYSPALEIVQLKTLVCLIREALAYGNPRESSFPLETSQDGDTSV